MDWIGEAAARWAAYWRTTTVTVAVAGLSRSGKTVFITSAIANLIAAQGGEDGKKAMGSSLFSTKGAFERLVSPESYTATRGKRFPYIGM